MSVGASLDVLMAQLQIQMERLEALLVTSPLRQGDAETVASRIVAGLRARDITTTLYVPASSARSDEAARETTSPALRDQTRNLDASSRTFTPAQAGTPQLARTLIASPGTVVVAAAPGVLEDPSALFLAAAADAVLLVVQARRTTRADLTRARVEIEAAGGRLVGAVLRE